MEKLPSPMIRPKMKSVASLLSTRLGLEDGDVVGDAVLAAELLRFEGGLLGDWGAAGLLATLVALLRLLASLERRESEL